MAATWVGRIGGLAMKGGVGAQVRVWVWGSVRDVEGMELEEL